MDVRYVFSALVAAFCIFLPRNDHLVPEYCASAGRGNLSSALNEKKRPPEGGL
jgi:hypothetical protein